MAGKKLITSERAREILQLLIDQKPVDLAAWARKNNLPQNTIRTICQAYATANGGVTIPFVATAVAQGLLPIDKVLSSLIATERSRDERIAKRRQHVAKIKKKRLTAMRFIVATMNDLMNRVAELETQLGLASTPFSMENVRKLAKSFMASIDSYARTDQSPSDAVQSRSNMLLGLLAIAQWWKSANPTAKILTQPDLGDDLSDNFIRLLDTRGEVLASLRLLSVEPKKIRAEYISANGVVTAILHEEDFVAAVLSHAKAPATT